MNRACLLWILLPLLILGAASCTQKRPQNLFESAHFHFYYSAESDAVLKDIEQALEGEYERITSALGIRPEKPFKVFLYPDIKSYRKAVGGPKTSDESVGTVKGVDMHALTPEQSVHGYDETMVILVHEWVHSLVNHINGSMDKNNYAIPIWLNEGLAVSLSGQMDKAGWRPHLAEAIQKREFLSIAEDLTPDSFSGKAYPYSCTLVEFLLETYGREVLVSIIRAPEELNTLLDCSIDELQQGWEEYLIRTYAPEFLSYAGDGRAKILETICHASPIL